MPHTSDQARSLRAITPRVIAGEVRDFLRGHERRRRQFPRSLLVGLIAGLIAVAFKVAIEYVNEWRGELVGWAHTLPTWLGILFPIAVGATGAGVGVWLVQRFAPETSGSGIPHLKAVLHRLRGMHWPRILWVKFVAGIASIGSGLVAGREGPTVQLGGAVGQMVSRWFRSTARERQTLIAAGAGAGLAAAFNAPLSGVMFVLEEVQRDFTPTVFTATFVSCVVADVVARLFTGQLPAFHVAPHPTPPLGSLPLLVVLGVVAGLLGVVFNRALLGSLRLFARTAHWPRGLAAALVGGSIGLIGWFLPQALGGGHELVEETLAGDTVLGMMFLLFVVRFALTMFSYGTGAPGGVFAPLLVLGAQMGLAIGQLGARFFPEAVPDPTMFAVVGMAAYFTAIVRAPLTGIVLVVEMTGNYSLMLPLLIACFCAYGIADLLGDRPIYEALLERDLLRSNSAPELEKTLLLELPVEHNAPYDGCTIEELDLPPGCLIVTVERGLASHVPSPDFVLRAGDRISAVIAPNAADGAIMLREGTKAGGKVEVGSDR